MAKAGNTGLYRLPPNVPNSQNFAHQIERTTVHPIRAPIRIRVPSTNARNATENTSHGTQFTKWPIVSIVKFQVAAYYNKRPPPTPHPKIRDTATGGAFGKI